MYFFRCIITIGVARGCALGARAKGGKNSWWGKFTGETCKCTPWQRVHPRGRAT